MRIDFFHVDLLPKTSIKGVSEACTDNSVELELTLNKNFTTYKKSKFKDGYDYSEILKKLEDEDSDSKTNQFISRERLFDLKKSIEEDNYKINSKALLISLIKYTERI